MNSVISVTRNIFIAHLYEVFWFSDLFKWEQKNIKFTCSALSSANNIFYLELFLLFLCMLYGYLEIQFLMFQVLQISDAPASACLKKKSVKSYTATLKF